MARRHPAVNLGVAGGHLASRFAAWSAGVPVTCSVGGADHDSRLWSGVATARPRHRQCVWPPNPLSGLPVSRDMPWLSALAQGLFS